MKNSIFQSVNLPSPEMAKVKTPSEVKKENRENPTTEEKAISKKISNLEIEFSDLERKPKTRLNKIELLKVQIKLYYHIERMPKMNKNKVRKLSKVIKDIENNNSLKELEKLERKLN
jgi:hypothetical protein